MRKTALLTGVAGVLLMAAPAFAQDGAPAQTPPVPAQAAPPAGEQAAPEQPATLTLQPGADVKGSDGMVLGQLEGARNTETGQELTVRDPDGQLRAVPVSSGVRQEGAGVAVGWTSAQFAAAPAITEEAAPVADPSATPMPDETGVVPPTPPTLPPATTPTDPAPDVVGPTVPEASDA